MTKVLYLVAVKAPRGREESFVAHLSEVQASDVRRYLSGKKQNGVISGFQVTIFRPLNASELHQEFVGMGLDY